MGTSDTEMYDLNPASAVVEIVPMTAPQYPDQDLQKLLEMKEKEASAS
ncbi:hypothetical protein [Viscerimonas tarda]